LAGIDPCALSRLFPDKKKEKNKMDKKKLYILTVCHVRRNNKTTLFANTRSEHSRIPSFDHRPLSKLEYRKNGREKLDKKNSKKESFSNLKVER